MTGQSQAKRPLTDTHPEIEAMQIRLLREMPIERRLIILSRWIQTVRTMTFEGLRERYPAASEAELRWRFAALHYGADLAIKTLGLPPWEEEADE